MNEKQEPPFCMQIEMTEGCNLMCGFCGLQGIREKAGKDFKFLTLELAAWIAYKISIARKNHGWNPRLEFAMHGEPTMNPDHVEIIRTFRAYLPKTHLMVTSNGGGLLKGGDITANINALMDAGLNVLLLDNYEAVKIIPKVLSGYGGPHPVYQYPADVDANPHRRRKSDEHDIVVVDDISAASKGNHSKLNNHAGSAFPKNQDGEGKRCAKPFRELSIRWDGNIAMCCNDWRGVHKVANIMDLDTLEEIWQHPQFQASRRKLLRGQRDSGACDGCDAVSYRPGLLPDHKGQAWLPTPTAADAALLAQGSSGVPYATPVLRPYELTIGGKTV